MKGERLIAAMILGGMLWIGLGYIVHEKLLLAIGVVELLGTSVLILVLDKEDK